MYFVESFFNKWQEFNSGDLSVVSH